MYEDIRIAKTQRAIYTAFRRLLETQSFRKLTIRDICTEAMVSRATFYSHFNDKFDLLQSWLSQLELLGLVIQGSYEEKELLLNDFIYQNKTVIRHLLQGADEETLGQFCNFLGQIMSFPDNGSPETPEDIVRAQFFAGGMIQYITWQINHNFPDEVAPLNIHIHKIIQLFKEWN